MKKIRLQGELARLFGAEWNLDVRTPAEAFRAIEANKPGIRAFMIESAAKGVGYRVLLDEDAMQASRLTDPFGREVMTVVPVIAGAGKDGLMGIVLGAALIWASGGLATTAIIGSMSMSSIAGSVGLSLVLGGVAQMLAGTPQAPSNQDANIAEGKASYFFSGPVNVTRQGNPVPIGYGTLYVGSQVVSAGIKAENIA